MIFVITVSQWSFIWLRVIKYLLLLLRIPRYNPLRKPALDMFRVNTCAYAREETPPPPLSPFFTSFCLPLTRSTFPLEPVPFFFLLSSLSLSFRASFSNQRYWNYFFEFKRLGRFHFQFYGVVFVRIRGCFLFSFFFLEQQTKEDSINLVNYWILESNRVFHVGEMEVIIDDYWFLMV